MLFPLLSPPTVDGKKVHLFCVGVREVATDCQQQERKEETGMEGLEPAKEGESTYQFSQPLPLFDPSGLLPDVTLHDTWFTSTLKCSSSILPTTSRHHLFKKNKIKNCLYINEAWHTHILFLLCPSVMKY